MTDHRFDTSWGEGWLRVDAAGAIVALHPPGSRVPASAAAITAAPERARVLAGALARFFDGEPVDLATRSEVAAWLDAAGVRGFRRDALLHLFDVPHGVTLTYGELADITGHPRAARAAGSACANNPLPIVVPCHRVLPASGHLGNYGGMGPAYKRRLLDLEHAAASA